jgi:hypothetical protein
VPGFHGGLTNPRQNIDEALLGLVYVRSEAVVAALFDLWLDDLAPQLLAATGLPLASLAAFRPSSALSPEMDQALRALDGVLRGPSRLAETADHAARLAADLLAHPDASTRRCAYEQVCGWSH